MYIAQPIEWTDRGVVMLDQRLLPTEEVHYTYTTYQEAVFTADLLRPRRVRKILLVTESMHMRRAKLLFEKAGLAVLPALSDRNFEAAVAPQDRLMLIFRIAEETAALIYYRIAGYI